RPERAHPPGLQRHAALPAGHRRRRHEGHADAARRVLHPGAAASARSHHRVRPVRVRALEPLRHARHVQRRGRPDPPARPPRRVRARSGRQPRMHPDEQRQDHPAREGAPPRHPGGDQGVNRRGPHASVLLAAAFLLPAVAFLSITGVAGASYGATSNSGLPPARRSELIKLFRADVKPLGLRVQRGMLENIATDTEDPNGTHLALYVAPRSTAYSDADYVRSFTKLVHQIVPGVFDRWKGLQSFDICQEPADDSRAEPPPVTQVFVTRSGLDRVANWRRAG